MYINDVIRIGKQRKKRSKIMIDVDKLTNSLINFFIQLRKLGIMSILFSKKSLNSYNF